MENDLISRSALLEEISSLTITITGLREGKGVLREVMTEYRKAILRTIDEAPAVDAVEVCRCKDCKHNNEEKALRKGGIWCEYWGIDPSTDDFCKRGERRSNNAD